MKYDEDKMIIDYRLVHNSKINDDNNVVMQNNNTCTQIRIRVSFTR